MKIIEVKNLSKRYITFPDRRFLIKDVFFFWRKRRAQELRALKEINFDVEKGETVGIIGENGAGKSTILKVLNGITPATSGLIKTKGRISGVLELGIGFHPELTGRENLYLNAALLGLSRRYVEKKFEDIVKFSGLEKFIELQIKQYSAGMLLRLAFSLAINVDPDILLIDEVLAVGDEAFQRRCINKIRELKNSGRTIIFVSHDLSLVLSLCDRVIFIREGRIVKIGKPDDAIAFYLETVGEKKGIGLLQKNLLDIIFNNGEVRMFFQDKEITKDLGLYSSLYINSRWHNSTQAEWTIEKSSPNQLIAKGNFKKLSISQTWKFNIQNEGEILFDVDTSSPTPTKIDKTQLNLFLSDAYTDYLTPYEKGSFPEISQADKLWYEIFQTPQVPRAIAVKDSKNTFPNLALEPQDELTHPKLFNADYQLNGRVVQLTNPNNSFSAKLLLGLEDIDEYIRPFILIEEQKKHQAILAEEEKKRQELESRTIQKGPFRLIFEMGGIKLFFKDKELTKDMGLYTSLYSEYCWHDSTEASWKICKEEKNRLIAVGRLKDLSLLQNWEFKFLDNSILLSIDIEPYEDVHIEQGRISLIIQDKYDNWFMRKQKGRFPKILFNHWIDLLDRNVVGNYVGARCNKSLLQLPTITMQLLNKLDCSLIRISNTDFRSNARILQLLKLEPKHRFNFHPGNYKYMKLKLTLDEI